MTQDSSIFSSVSATEAIAARLERMVAAGTSQAIEAVIRAFDPIKDEIRQRGKLPRNRLGSVFSVLANSLRKIGSVVWFDEAIRSTSSLSAKDARNCRLVVVFINPDYDEDLGERWFSFLSVEATLERSQFFLRFDWLDIEMTPHVLSRFMQRDQKDLSEFFKGLGSAMESASLLAQLAGQYEGAAISLPHASGLLLGNVVGFFDSKPEERLWPMEVQFRGGKTTTGVGSRSRPGDSHLVARMRTYIDKASLTGYRADLHDQLDAWAASHAEGINTWWHMASFGSSRLSVGDGNSEERAKATVSAAIDSARAIVDGKAWKLLASRKPGEG